MMFAYENQTLSFQIVLGSSKSGAAARGSEQPLRRTRLVRETERERETERQKERGPGSSSVTVRHGKVMS